jgi:hypothetical protein
MGKTIGYCLNQAEPNPHSIPLSSSHAKTNADAHAYPDTNAHTHATANAPEAHSVTYADALTHQQLRRV